MINKVGASTDLSSVDYKQTAAATENVWEKYARDLAELKTNPPRQFAVTISRYRAYQSVEFPAWKIPVLIAKGKMSAGNTPPLYDARIIMTEQYLNMVRNGMGEEYVRDIVEIDPETGKPLASQSANLALTNPSATETTSLTRAASSTGPTPQTETVSKTQTQQAQSTAPTASRQRIASTSAKARQSAPLALPKEEPFDFTKLSPELQETALQLAEQLLSAALRRLSESDQLGADLSTLLNQTA
jgi:hypothetical protein